MRFSPSPTIGVATTVGWNGRAYDTFDALAYARAHGFPLLQVYLNPELVANAGLRQRVVHQAAAAGIHLLGHAPALLGDGPATAPAVTAAARDLLQNEPMKWVVHHFDENLPVAETLAWVERLLADGVIPCVENFHGDAGREAACKHYTNYLELLQTLRARGLEVPAVIDIPRFFDPKLGLTHDESSDLTVNVLGELARLGVPVILHLIDTSVADVTQRHRWCPIGAGVIGYDTLLPRALTVGLRVPAVVLEFDDKGNAPPSWIFLERHLTQDM